MGFFDKLFGGTDKSAQKKTLQDNAQRQKFIEQQMGQARGDLLGLAPGMQQNLKVLFTESFRQQLTRQKLQLRIWLRQKAWFMRERCHPPG